MKDLWERCLEMIMEEIGLKNFDMWFKPLKRPHMESDKLILQVPNKFFKEWIEDNYLPTIKNILRTLTERETQIVLQVEEKPFNEQKERPRQEIPLPHLQRSFNLNPKYTFSSFVVGLCNQFAHAASLAVANQPAKSFNPLFVYGGVGLGKTHLLCAIGNHLLPASRDLKISYVTSESFMNELINSIRYEKTGEFREKFRKIDVLLIDDIQFLAGKERTQEEFFHTFNTLHNSRKQIVLTSDTYPKNIKGLEERLRSRFEWGLIADIQPPDIETRIAIVKKKSEEEGINLKEEVIMFLASNIKNNIRELEGCLIRVGAFASLYSSEITLDFTKKVLKDLISQDSKTITVDFIQKIVANYYNLKVSDLKAAKKVKSIALPRQIAMYLCRILTQASFPVIGEKFGGKDHSTVIHAVNKIEEEIKKGGYMKNTVESLKNLIESQT